MARITYVYIDTVFGFYGAFFLFLNTRRYCLVGLFGHMLFWVSYMHVFCIFVFALVQCN